MGRGRAKAKQTKVARELKYRSFNMDVNSLAAELRPAGEDEHRVPDAYADLAEEYGGGEEPDRSVPDTSDPEASDSDDSSAEAADESPDEDYQLRRSG